MTPFSVRLSEAVSERGPVCIGLDPHLHRLPAVRRAAYEHLEGAAFRAAAAAQVQDWGLEVLDAVSDLAAAIKPQVAFFEQLGAPGVAALEVLSARARELGLILLLDAKRGDIGSTAEGYARATLDAGGPIGADAVTLNPYLGPESLAPFLKRCDADGKGLFVLVRTSNAGADALQGDGVAEKVSQWISEWNQSRLDPQGLGPVGAVVGATVPEEAIELRAQLQGAWILVPGYGAQGGSAADTLPCFRGDGLGALVNSSRGVLFAGQGEADRYEADPVGLVREHAEQMVRTLKALHE